MKKKKIEIKLKKKERAQLNQFIKKGTAQAREITRARILLLSDSGKAPSIISDILGVTMKTIQSIKEHYLEGSLDRALHDNPRSGAPTKFEGKHRAQITALACTEAPDGYAKWGLSLLADKAVETGIVDTISKAHIARILKKTK